MEGGRGGEEAESLAAGSGLSITAGGSAALGEGGCRGAVPPLGQPGKQPILQPGHGLGSAPRCLFKINWC